MIYIEERRGRVRVVVVMVPPQKREDECDHQLHSWCMGEYDKSGKMTIAREVGEKSPENRDPWAGVPLAVMTLVHHARCLVRGAYSY